MKQIFLILSVFVLAIGMSSCGKGYDLDKCKTLQEKIDNGDELTQEDYADIIGQAKALCGFLECFEPGTNINVKARRCFASRGAKHHGLCQCFDTGH